MVHSLKFHAEKKALASLLLGGAPDLALDINFSVCADCHHFLTHAAEMLGREIRVSEPKLRHDFGARGGCSCGDGGYPAVGRHCGRAEPARAKRS